MKQDNKHFMFWTQKISPPPGFNPWTIQLIVSRYTPLSLSLKKLHGGRLGGEFLHWEPWKIC
jgi:hypothetical protein